MGPLAGFTVLVTRPAGRGQRLVAAVEAAGGQVLWLPTLVIEASPDSEPSLSHIAHLDQFDQLIFTSVPAVRHTLDRSPGGLTGPVWAVGRRTADELEGLAITARVPKAGFNSEALLAEAELEAVASSRIAILCAPGGRTLLADTLRARGARVIPIYVYRRYPAPGGDPHLLRQVADHCLLTATSVEVLDGLTRMIREAGLELADRPLVVNAERVAKAARALGYRRLVCAGAADAESMFNGLLLAVA